MNAAAALTIAVFLLAVTGWGLVLAATRRRPATGFLIAVAIGELELLVQAAVAVGFLIAGHEPDSMGEFIGYLVVTTGLLPFALVRARAEEATPFDAAVVAVTAFAVAVAVLRLLSLW